MARNSERNRRMLAEYEAGRTMEQLSEEYGLSPHSIAAILTGERHRRNLSPEPFYRTLRANPEDYVQAQEAVRNTQLKSGLPITVLSRGIP